MATPLRTSQIEGYEGMSNEPNIDYLSLLKKNLSAQNLMYIADIIMEIEEEPLEDLMSYSRKNLNSLLDEIHEDETNKYRIKVSHRNKFAKCVIEMRMRRNESLAQQTIAAPATSKVKLLFVDEREQQAIQCIQLGQQFMTNELAKIKKLYIGLDENDKIVRQNLQQLCGSLKQQIDHKQKQMIAFLDGLYQYRLNEINSRYQITQQSAKNVAQLSQNYENYFTDNTLSKKDRKSKLIAAENSIAIETHRVNKYNKNCSMNMNIAINKKAAAQLFNQCLDLRNVEINLPPVKSCKVYGTIIKWKIPPINEDILCLFGHKNRTPITCSIFYRDSAHEEKKDNNNNVNDWNEINVVVCGQNEYDMKRYAPCQATFQYTIDNILRCPMSKVMNIKSSQSMKKNNDIDDLVATRWNARGHMARLGATGKYYCGKSGDRRCGCCDERCGPTNGCNCSSCMKLDIKYRMLPKGYLVNNLGFVSRISHQTGKFYCGRVFMMEERSFHDGYCGPSNGPNCSSCMVLDAYSSKVYAALLK